MRQSSRLLLAFESGFRLATANDRHFVQQTMLISLENYPPGPVFPHTANVRYPASID